MIIINPQTLAKVSFRRGPDEIIEADDLELYANQVSKADGSQFEYDTPRAGLIGTLVRDNEIFRAVVNRRDMIDMLGSKRCVCGGEKERQRSHCKACYFSLSDDQRRAIYRRFGHGYEAAFLDSLATLIDQGRTDRDKIRAAIPKRKGLTT